MLHDRTAALLALALLPAACAVDGDGDGYDETVDCDDVDPAVHPGAREYWDRKDNDCDGVADVSSQYRWFDEVEPNDTLFEDCYLDGGQWLGTLAPTGMASFVDGMIDHVVPVDYDLGDTDCLVFRLAELAVLHVHIAWPEADADLDFAVWSRWEDGTKQAFIGSQDDIAPFTTGGASNGAMSPDEPIYLWLAAYDGPPTSYRVTLWTSEGGEEGE